MINTDHLSTKSDFEAALAQALKMLSTAQYNINKMKYRQSSFANYQKYDNALRMKLEVIEGFQLYIQQPIDEVLKEKCIGRILELEAQIPKLQEAAQKRGVQKFLLYAMKQTVYEAHVRMLDEYVLQLQGSIAAMR
jgi:hypothetical protein